MIDAEHITLKVGRDYDEESNRVVLTFEKCSGPMDGQRFAAEFYLENWEDFLAHLLALEVPS